MSKEYKKNYISNFLIRLDLETKLNEGEYDKLLVLLTKDFPINEKEIYKIEILLLILMRRITQNLCCQNQN